jgi:hypothetical protein
VYKKRAAKAIVQLLALFYYNNIRDEERVVLESHFFWLLGQHYLLLL